MIRGSCIGFEVGWERGFEGLERGEDCWSLEVLDCIDEMACSQKEVN